MAKSDPEALAAALRDNLKRRKSRMRAAQEGSAPFEPVDSGADEEGDVVPATHGQSDSAWVAEGSKKSA